MTVPFMEGHPMLMQVPVPPLPPEVVVMSGGPPEEMMVILTLATLAVGFFLLRPLFRAWARRIEGGASPELVADVEHLRERLQDVDLLHQRIGELEERLDFAERMLTEGKRQERVGSRE